MCKLKIIVNTSYLQDDIERYLSLKPKRPRRAVQACLQCQSRKIKCTGSSPCECCKARKVDCVYNEKPLKHYSSNSVRQGPSDSRVAKAAQHEKRVTTRAPGDGSFKPRLSLNKSPTPGRNHPYYRYAGASSSTGASKQELVQNASSNDVSIPDKSNLLSARPSSPRVKATSPDTTSSGASKQSLAWSDSRHEDASASSSDIIPHFDSNNLPALPERSFVSRFYKLMGNYLPYMDHESFERGLSQGPLSMSLLYSMAALVSRLDPVDGAANHQSGRLAGSTDIPSNIDLYTKASKGLVYPYISTPRLDVVYTLVLIAYNELADARNTSLWTWSGMAIRMCYDLGLNDPKHAATHDQSLYRQVLGSVICLDRIVSLSMSRHTTIPDQDIASLSWLENEACNVSVTSSMDRLHGPFRHLCRLMTIASRMFNLVSSMRNDNAIMRDQTTLVDYIGVLTEFHTQLPVDLYFDIRNFQAARKSNQSQIFLTIHVWHQALLILVHCPVWSQANSRHDGTFSGQGYSSLSQLQSETASQCISQIGDMISLADLIDPSSYTASPFMAQPLYLAASTALNLSKFQTNTPYLEYSTRKAYSTCRAALARMQAVWRGVASHLHSLDELQSTCCVNNDTNIGVHTNESPNQANTDDLRPESTFMSSMTAGGEAAVVAAPEYDINAASIISPFSLSSTSSTDYSHASGLLPWGEMLDPTSTESNEWDPEMLPWEMTDWTTPAHLQSQQQDGHALTNPCENTHLTDAMDQPLCVQSPSAAVDGFPQVGFCMEEMVDQNVQ
jgi:hypothetical protein